MTEPLAVASRLHYAAVPLVLRDFDDEIVVFNETTWDTHVLNAAAAAVLQLLIERPRSVSEVADALCQWLETDEAQDATQHATRLLDELLDLGLLNAVPSP